MIIGVISDTHIADITQKLPPKLIQGLKNTDLIIHAGDIVELEILDQLKSVCPQIRAVAGNMDSEKTKEMLPVKELITAGRFKIGVMHGWGPADGLPELLLEEFRNDKPDIIIFGHSHKPFNKKRKGVLLFNPGSVTDTVYAPYNSYGILKVTDRIKSKIVKL